MSISHQCVVLLGGLGTRLGDLVKDRPKPLLDVAGGPFVNHLIRNLVRHGFDNIVLLASYKAAVVREMVDQGVIGGGTGAVIQVMVEDIPLGTAGALYNARALLSDEFLMMNGDSLFDFNFLDLAARPIASVWTGRLALRQIPDARRFGVVTVDGERITAFKERPNVPGAGTVNGGVYYLRRQVLDEITNFPCSIERDVFPRLAAHGRLFGFCYNGNFIDIGIPADLERARRELPGHSFPAVFFDSDSVLNYDDGYPHSIEYFRWVDGAKEIIKRLNDAGWFVFVITNKASISYGYCDEAKVRSLHAWMNEELRPMGAHIDDFRFCPHHSYAVSAELAGSCSCGTPQLGAILDIMKTWSVDAAKSWLIGDKQSDISAAKSAGLRSILVNELGLWAAASLVDTEID